MDVLVAESMAVFVGVPAQVPAGPSAAQREALTVLREAAGRADADGDALSAAALREAAVVLARRTGAVVAGPRVLARCFGTYGLLVANAPLSLEGLRPRARATLRLLSAHAGRPVHREELLGALWPDVDPDAALRSLLTTLSSLRRLLQSTPAEGALQRDGQAYRLDPGLVSADVREADGLLRDVRALKVTDPVAAAVRAQRALDLYAGELLGEEGPYDWVLALRDEWRTRMAGAAHDLAVLRYRGGDVVGAAAAARRGLVIDRQNDPLWRVLVAALHADGDIAAAERAATEYDGVLAGLAG